MTAPQTPPPCPDWCRRDAHGPSRSHMSRAFGNTVYVAIVQDPGRKPEIHFSSYSPDDPVLAVTAAEARMLAALMNEHMAAALRQAADELDRITSGGTS